MTEIIEDVSKNKSFIAHIMAQAKDYMRIELRIKIELVAEIPQTIRGGV